MKEIQYRVVQKNENCFVPQWKNGWFWWAFSDGLGGGMDGPLKCKTLEEARKVIAEDRQLIRNTSPSFSFHRKIWADK